MKPAKQILILTASPRKNGNSTILGIRSCQGGQSRRRRSGCSTDKPSKDCPRNACESCITKPEPDVSSRTICNHYIKKSKTHRESFSATPVYWFNISAQMKLLIDRAYAIQGKGNWAFTGKDVEVTLNLRGRGRFHIRWNQRATFFPGHMCFYQSQSPGNGVWYRR